MRLRRDWRRSLSIVGTVLLAVTSFVVLTGSASTARLVTTGTVNSNFHTAYDVLVRPAGSRTAQEVATGRVRPNYLSGTFGGISLEQLRTIRAVSGVDVAAPVAMIGEVFQTVDMTVDVTGAIDGTGPSVFRFASSVLTMGGSGRTSGLSGYVYIDDGVRVAFDGGQPHGVRAGSPSSAPVTVCPATPVGQSPFEPTGLYSAQCWDRLSGQGGLGWPVGAGRVAVVVPVSLPVIVAAVDPEAENALTGLAGAVTSGQPLRSGDVPSSDGTQIAVPVLASSTSFVDETTQVRVEKLPRSIAQSIRGGVDFATVRSLVRAATGTPVMTTSFTAAQAQELWLRGGRRTGGGRIYPRLMFQPSTVTFATSAAGLTPQVTHLDASIWANHSISNEPWVNVPVTASDTGYRTITAIPATEGLHVGLVKVGTFDPARARAQSDLAEVPLETYQPPTADPADTASAALLRGPLRPDSNPAGYLQSPPLLLTTLAALPLFADPNNFIQPPGTLASRAPLSAIRVRVAGVTGADEVSRERIRLVADQISAATGLDVDVTAGSSPAPVTVGLPPTLHGTPALAITERWAQKGVATAIITAIDTKSLALFLLILATTALVVAIAAHAAIRSRRVELGILSALGWRPATIVREVATELLILSGLAGSLGALLAWPLGALLGAEVPPWRALLAIPAAFTLAFTAGIGPARLAARTTPAPVVTAIVSQRPSRRARRLRGTMSLAIAFLARRPGRALAACSSLALGVGALGILSGVLTGFQGAVVGTVLGNAVSLQVRGADIVAAVLLTMIGIGGLVDVLYLDLREQAPAYAALQACGWRDRTLRRLVIQQASLIAAAGALIGAALAVSALASLTQLSPTLVLTIAGIATMGGLIAVAGALAPASSLKRMSLARLLAED